MTATTLSKLTSELKSAFKGSYVQGLFDPIQTHALYGISKDDLIQAKKILSEHKATRFRTVKATGKGFVILCFKIKQ